MKLTPILASDTTAAFLSIVLVLFWVVIGGGTVPGLLAIIFYFVREKGSQSKSTGLALGLISAGVGIAAVLFLVVFTQRVGFLGWAGVSTPLVIGVFAIVL